MTTPLAWNAHLVPMSRSGFSVVAAGPQDLADVVRLLAEMTAPAEGPGDAVVATSAHAAWAQALLASRLWLVLLLLDPQGTACGIAVAEYIAYDVDIRSRVLRCKHIHVRRQREGSLLAPSSLLLKALLEAARRSPMLRDVFIVSTGARAHHRLGRILTRYGFRRIGTQHIGFGRGQAPQPPDDMREIGAIHCLSPDERAQLSDMASAFLAESDRAFLGPITLDLDRLMAMALGHGDPTAVAFLAHHGGKVAGFIAGHVGGLPLSPRRYLKSTFFYVKPGLRASALSLKLFDAFGARARALGLDGALLGTSSAISTDRVCRLLSLRGFAWCGDVLSARVQREASA